MVTRLPSSPKTATGGPSVVGNNRDKIPGRGPHEPHRRPVTLCLLAAGRRRACGCQPCIITVTLPLGTRTMDN
jgi:hypothetical protein